VPYQRRTVLSTPVLSWQEAELQSAQPGWSDEYRVQGPRLLLPLDGQFDCRLGGRRWSCDAASAVWLTPQQGYRLRQPRRGQRSLVIALPDPGAPAGSREMAPADHLALALLRRRWLAGHAEVLEVEERLLAWASRLLGPDPAADAHHPAVERARDYLAQHFAQAAHLRDVADAAASSPFHLARNFRRRTGLSLHAFRNRLRMAEALRRIDAGERNLGGLAHELGFSSQSHFGAAFKAAFGWPPAQLRTILIAKGARR
jgi:AraC-like DNA-binding protein